MFRRQSLIAVGAALLLGVAAVVLLNAYLNGLDNSREGTGPIRTTRIAVARAPLEFGARITPDKVALVDWPEASVPNGSFRSIAELIGPQRTRFVLRPISQGEPILAGRLSGDGAPPSVAAMLAPDMRAVSLRISDVAGVSGFVLPGDRVDVIMTREVGQQQISDVLLRNLRVLAIDQHYSQKGQEMTSGEAAGLKTATLEVSQPDAQKLALGAAVGTLSLALRSPKTLGAAMTETSAPLRSAQLAGGAPAPSPLPLVAARSAAPRPAPRSVALPARPAGPMVEIVRGVAAHQYEVTSYVGL